MLRLLKQTCWLLLLGLQFPNPAVGGNPPSPPPTSIQHSGIPASLCPQDLKTAIDPVIARPKLQNSRWGIKIQTLDSGETLYAIDADKYFLAASNNKLLTTAAALLHFGPQFRWRTSIYGTGNPPNLKTLRVVGRGDPTLTTTHLQNLVRQLKQQGIRRLETLIVNDSYFPEDSINSSWEWGDIIFYYAPPVNSLILNQNTVTLQLIPQKIGEPLQLEWSDLIAGKQWQVNNQTIGTSEETASKITIQGVLGRNLLEIEGRLAIQAKPEIFRLAIPEPAAYFLETLQTLLLAEKIKINRAVIERDLPKGELGKELAIIESEPLALLIQEINQNSNNLFAESLFKTLEKSAQEDKKIKVLKQHLTNLGIPETSYYLADGSGLSRQNLVSPTALVQTLRLMAKTDLGEIYRDSLAVGGMSGTLTQRFKETKAEGRLWAKTGTLSGVSALSGYLETADYQPLAFSIIINNSQLPATELRKGIDEIILLLSNLQTCDSQQMKDNEIEERTTVRPYW